MMRTLSVLSRWKARLRLQERPPVAVEIASAGVLAAAKTVASDIKYAYRPLPVGAVTPGVNQPNLRNPEAISTALRSALEEVSGVMRSVTLLLPDPATRVFSLEFDSLPDDPSHVSAVLRLRLKKVVPFDIESARISYQLLDRSGNICKMLAVAVPKGVLNEYEAVVRDAGFQPGAVLPSALSALAALNSDEPVLSAYLSGVSLTTSITAGKNILLYRTHELPDNIDERTAEMQRDIAVALAYFEDELKTAPACVHYAGDLDADEFSRSVLAQPLPVKHYSASQQNGESPAFPFGSNPAGLVGALAGVRSA
ncbi:hypothetical protein [Occallatibacter savannae]|uniref:hypothetical protein n=1 Tax=Occallatibacter savannae TaxID=1002691 RepID=UPI000D69AADB|nr:hypothetical protein [Occallatibacter savannae]